jgi:hypothetical protein
MFLLKYIRFKKLSFYVSKTKHAAGKDTTHQNVARQPLGKHIPACSNGRCVSMDECYSSLLGKSQRASQLAVFCVVRAEPI